MERKTIGGFIATLRKANGMTQKELAEKLNVSDKTISRWERDDGAPDLSAIPVIAEIFGVTCDELLRGERKPMAEWMKSQSKEAEVGRMKSLPEQTDAEGVDGLQKQNDGKCDGTGGITATNQKLTLKGEKQCQRLLAVGLSKYKTKTFITMGISALGLIAAMIGNLGFLRAYIGFFVGVAFYLAAVVCQAIFVNGAFLTVADEDLDELEVGRFKYAVVTLAEWSLGLAVVLFGFTLPLVIFAYDTYVGVSAETWFLQGTAFVVLTLMLYCVICYFLNAALLKRGVYRLEGKAEQIYLANHAWKRKCAIWVSGAVLCTFILHMVTTEMISIADLSQGTQFHDYESFVAFMEQDIPYSDYAYYSSNAREYAEPVAAPAGEITYYDEQGNVISEEEALHRELTDSEGNVVCEYMDRNETVASISYSDRDGNLLPITVFTHADMRGGRAKMSLINSAFVAVYFLEGIAGIWIYFRKRVKR